MTTHLGLQRILLPSAQVSSLTTGSITLPSARGQFVEGSYDSISSTIVTSASSSSITLSSIPSTYKHLVLRVIAKNDQSGETYWNNLKVTFNTDTNQNNYFSFRVMADGNSTASTANADTSALGSYNGGGQGSNLFSANIFEFLDYTDTNKYKNARCFFGTGYAGGTYSATGFTTTTWENTAAINSLTLITGSGNFAVGTTVSLYGLETV